MFTRLEKHQGHDGHIGVEVIIDALVKQRGSHEGHNLTILKGLCYVSNRSQKVIPRAYGTSQSSERYDTHKQGNVGPKDREASRINEVLHAVVDSRVTLSGLHYNNLSFYEKFVDIGFIREPLGLVEMVKHT